MRRQNNFDNMDTCSCKNQRLKSIKEEVKDGNYLQPHLFATTQLPTYSINEIIGIIKSASLLIETLNLPNNNEQQIYYPETDTRQLVKPTVHNNKIKSFLCIQGFETDGHLFVQDALDKGAELLFTEKPFPSLPVPQIIVSNSRKTLALLAKQYFSNPTEKFHLIGITGTNGKTSCVKFIESMLSDWLPAALGMDKVNAKINNQKLSVGTIGTLGYTINGKQYPLDRTTPDITELNSIFKLFNEQGVKYVVMEVSSHALKLDRVFGLNFDLALFTNLSREHLDFHTDMEDYFQSKSLLFDYLSENKGAAIINIDDKYGKILYNSYPYEKYAVGIKADKNKADIEYDALNKSINGTEIKLSFNKEINLTTGKLSGSYIFNTCYLGLHNVFNISVSLSATLLLLSKIIMKPFSAYTGTIETKEMEKTKKESQEQKNEANNTLYSLSNEQIRNFLSPTLLAKLIPDNIPGRLELVKGTTIRCYIDYAHTPEAIMLSCKTLKEALNNTKSDYHYKRPPYIQSNQGESSARLDSPPQRRLICVFGAGGNRDKGKRKEMTDAAIKYADMLIITYDNPRDENGVDIIFDLIQHLHPLSPYLIVCNRRQAIKTAVNIANENDIVLIAGKGHETYQIIGKEKFHFNDYEECINALNNNKKLDYNNQYESEATTELAVPLDLVQLKLLLEYCTKKDLEIDRWDDDGYSVDINKMNTVRKSIIKQFSSKCGTSPIIENISTDTRTIKENSLFIALEGENFDGHNFVAQALNKSGNYAVVKKGFIQHNSGQHLIETKDTLIALALIAKKYKTLFSPLTIGITGSTGKTSTKEYCYNVISQRYKTLKNVANENNIIGVTRTILNLNSDYSCLLLELGTNKKGEMQLLADTCSPDIATIINIGYSHLEAFGNLYGVYREKSSLLNRNMTHRIIQGNDEILSEKSDVPNIKIMCDDSKDGFNFRVLKINNSEETFSIVLDKQIENENSFYLPTNIGFLAKNASFAILIGKLIGLSTQDIRKGLLQHTYTHNRMEILKYHNNIVISDCYNANPCSMKEAINFWCGYQTDKVHIAVLGDMLELGSDSEKYHLDVSSYLKEKIKYMSHKTIIISVGKLSRLYEANYHYDNVEQLICSEGKNNPLKIEDAVVLLKGSHSIHLEKIIGR